jgi:hypothetical protein
MLYSFPVRGDIANEAQPKGAAPPIPFPICVVVILLPLTWIAYRVAGFGPPNV